RVESALLELETVERAAVLGLPEETWGELVAAAVVPVEEADPSPSELREALRARLPPHALPRVIGILRSLPRTASGTIDRTALAAVLEAVEPR
ncbi:MAG: AMP-binding enzyme, partial [Halodesulfurarchaeum sp.]